jgi:hypothetical protein
MEKPLKMCFPGPRRNHGVLPGPTIHFKLFKNLYAEGTHLKRETSLRLTAMRYYRALQKEE